MRKMVPQKFHRWLKVFEKVKLKRIPIITQPKTAKSLFIFFFFFFSF